MEVTYLKNSGFLVRTARFVLAFDVICRGKAPAAVRDAEHAVVLASHAHHDHYQPGVLAWRSDNPALQYVFSSDIPVKGVYSLSPGESWNGEGITVEACESTDVGVSFLVRCDGRVIFHAGDLNLWHWCHESTPEEVAQAEEAFQRAMKPLEGMPMDVAFFPLDPRMGEGFEAGAVQFLQKVPCKHFVPMHLQGRYDLAEEFAKRYADEPVWVHVFSREGQTVSLD